MLTVIAGEPQEVSAIFSVSHPLAMLAESESQFPPTIAFLGAKVGSGDTDVFVSSRLSVSSEVTKRIGTFKNPRLCDFHKGKLLLAHRSDDLVGSEHLTIINLATLDALENYDLHPSKILLHAKLANSAKGGAFVVQFDSNSRNFCMREVNGRQGEVADEGGVLKNEIAGKVHLLRDSAGLRAVYAKNNAESVLVSCDNPGSKELLPKFHSLLVCDDLVKNCETLVGTIDDLACVVVLEPKSNKFQQFRHVERNDIGKLNNIVGAALTGENTLVMACLDSIQQIVFVTLDSNGSVGVACDDIRVAPYTDQRIHFIRYQDQLLYLKSRDDYIRPHHVR